MGILNLLFGEKKAEKKRINTSKQRVISDEYDDEDDYDEEELFKKAFNKVMRDVLLVPNETIASLYKAYFKAFQKGSGREEEKAVFPHLCGSGWKWLEFDHWERIFQQKGQWPYMWKYYANLCNSFPKPSESVDEAIIHLNVKEMRQLLRDKGIKIKPAPKDRSEFEEAIKRSFSLDQLKPIIEPQFVSSWNYALQKCEEEKCRILINTIHNTVYSLRKENKIKGLSDGIIPYRIVIKNSFGACPYADEFAEKFKKGEITSFPPYFPGDGSMINVVFDKLR